MEVPNSTDFDYSSNFSFEIWVNPGANPTGTYQAIACNVDYTISTSAGWLLATDVGGGLIFQTGDGSIGAGLGWALEHSVNLSANSWNQVVAVVRSGAKEIWLNGVLVASGFGGGYPSSVPLKVGRCPTALNYPLGYSFDHAAIYQRALSGTEIADHFSDPGAPAAPAPISLWRLNETSVASPAADAQLVHPGAYVGSPQLGVTGRVGTAMRIPDPSDTVQSPGQTRASGCRDSGLAKVSCGQVADPVNSLTGAFEHVETDLGVAGTGVPLTIRRHYSSDNGWVHDQFVAWVDAGAGAKNVLVEGFQELMFTPAVGGGYSGAPGVLATFEQVAGGYRLTTADQVVYEFNDLGGFGLLTSKRDRNGQGITVAWNGFLIASVTDSAGVTATFAYDASDQLTSVSVPDGRSVSYGYTGGLLTSVTDVRGKVWSYTYDGSGRLATVVDPLGHTQVANVYGPDGRVSQQTDAVGETTTFLYNEVGSTLTTTVTDARGNEWTDFYESGVLVERDDALNNETGFVVDGDLNNTSVVSPLNETTTMTFDASGNVLTATAPPSLGGATKTFTYNANNDPLTVTDARGKVTAYTYTGAGNVESVTQDGQAAGSYTYDSGGRVLTSTDGNAHTTTYTYDAAGNTASVTNHLGEKTTHTYDAQGNVLTRVDAKGNVAGCGCAAQYTTTSTYNAAGQLLTETDTLGHVTSNVYDDAGRLTSTTDGNGKVTSHVYDDANRLLSTTAADGGVTSFTYDDVGNQLTVTDPLGHMTTNEYDANNRLVSTTTASGAKTTFFYDGNGNLVRQVEPRGNVLGADPDDYDTLFTFDAAGRMLTETDPLGHTTTHVYDNVGNEVSVTDPRGKTTTSTYDGRNRLLTTTAPDTGVTTFTYDVVGNKLTEKDPRNNITTYTYDAADRPASLTKPSGGKTTYGYDANGNQTSMVEPRGNVTGCGCAAQYTWTYVFDRANRKTGETSPLGHTTGFALDNVGNQLSVTDANSHVTAYTYDNVNRVKTVTAPDLGVTTYTYDVAGNMTAKKDARNNTTSYGYDLDNRRTTVTNPLGKVWTTSYDAAGHVASTVDANGNATPAGGDGTTTFTYDRAGRLTNINYSDTTPDVTYTYDNAGNRLSMIDESGSESRTYDNNNRLLTVTRGSNTFTYVYDLAGNLTSRTYPGGAATTYTYDVDNRMGAAVNSSLTTTYGYDPAGNLTTATLPSANAFVETRVYDRSGRLTEVQNKRGTATPLSRFQVTLDPVGNPTQWNRTGGLTQLQNYTYDANDRVATVCFAASCTPTSTNRIAWTYDKVGNRLTETRGATTTNYTYNVGDQMLTAGATNYTYDSNGNQLTAGTRSFTWNLANYLKTTAQGSTTSTYTYDGDNKRLQTSTGTAASAKVNFQWDVNHGLPQIARELDGNNTLQRQYIYGLQRIRQSNGTASYYHYDPLGSIANLTSSSGTTQWTWSYEPYGVIRTTSGTSPTNFLNYTGEYKDPTGLYHLRARQYDPTTGRFLATDPLAPEVRGGAVSSYSYVSAQPTVLVDPSGMRGSPSTAGTQFASYSTSAAPIDPGATGYTFTPWQRISDGFIGYWSGTATARALVKLGEAVTLSRGSQAQLVISPSSGGGLVDPTIYRSTRLVWDTWDSGVKFENGFVVPQSDRRYDRSLTDSPVLVLPGTRGGQATGQRRVRFIRVVHPAAENANQWVLALTQTTWTTTRDTGIAGWDLRVYLKGHKELSSPLSGGADPTLVTAICPYDPFNFAGESPRTPGSTPRG